MVVEAHEIKKRAAYDVNAPGSTALLSESG